MIRWTPNRKGIHQHSTRAQKGQNLASIFLNRRLCPAAGETSWGAAAVGLGTVVPGAKI